MAELITLYFHFSHDDLKKGQACPLEITDSLRKYYPVEIYISFIMSAGFYFYRDYLALMFCLPLVLYNIKMLIGKEFLCHAVFVEEYKQKDYMEKISWIKALFHTGLIFYVVVQFIVYFSKFISYWVVSN
jgi:Cornichon protein.